MGKTKPVWLVALHRQGRLHPQEGQGRIYTMKLTRRQMFAGLLAPVVAPKLLEGRYIEPAMLALANELDMRILKEPPLWLTIPKSYPHAG